ncbi:BspA family leucine-rich repeat surface protein [Psittacicella hinzii]|uniref:Surface protein n=1 Tax=Psittacicella hinzii TaxID=2028575 RepID=A0A3A1YGR8_9GAMM|nr:BspA family leucine-rich repeat surface protein [Psittacicella hinzii]RIY37433.1 hypothetical protein CKF58_05085 [Psittacicella hinzii]
MNFKNFSWGIIVANNGAQAYYDQNLNAFVKHTNNSELLNNLDLVDKDCPSLLASPSKKSKGFLRLSIEVGKFEYDKQLGIKKASYFLGYYRSVAQQGTDRPGNYAASFIFSYNKELNTPARVNSALRGLFKLNSFVLDKYTDSEQNVFTSSPDNQVIEVAGQTFRNDLLEIDRELEAKVDADFNQVSVKSLNSEKEPHLYFSAAEKSPEQLVSALVALFNSELIYRFKEIYIALDQDAIDNFKAQKSINIQSIDLLNTNVVVSSFVETKKYLQLVVQKTNQNIANLQQENQRTISKFNQEIANIKEANTSKVNQLIADSKAEVDARDKIIASHEANVQRLSNDLTRYSGELALYKQSNTPHAQKFIENSDTYKELSNKFIKCRRNLEKTNEKVTQLEEYIKDKDKELRSAKTTNLFVSIIAVVFSLLIIAFCAATVFGLIQVKTGSSNEPAQMTEKPTVKDLSTLKRDAISVADLGLDLQDADDLNDSSKYEGKLIFTNKDTLRKFIIDYIKETGSSNLNFIDVSNITDMSGLFAVNENENAINPNIADWDVSKVTNMSHMFENNTEFDGDLSNWRVINVTDMSYMFKGTYFYGDISKWDVSNVVNMTGMFENNNAIEKGFKSWTFNKDVKVDNMFCTRNDSEKYDTDRKNKLLENLPDSTSAGVNFQKAFCITTSTPKGKSNNRR